MTSTDANAEAERFFDGGSFPAFALFVIAFWELLLVAMLLGPSGDAARGGFAEEFRIWCFGYDPATGRLNAGYVMAMMGPPAVIAPLLALVWWEPLRALAARRRAWVWPFVSSALAVAVAATSFTALGREPEGDELPFPAESLRTELHSPALRLVNQDGETVDLAALRGRVVLLTAVYASCPMSCPLILGQAKAAIAAVPSELRGDLRVIAVSMDPAHDTPDVLAGLARTHQVEAPLYALVTGEPAEVERVLDDMGIARTRDPETGVIDHANLFLLVDRGGRIAYRLTLGERQRRWLTSALELLLREKPDGG
jgi:cytochrome oxidase Cu insertion factor (SCO1/SenC/PrrC family)